MFVMEMPVFPPFFRIAAKLAYVDSYCEAHMVWDESGYAELICCFGLNPASAMRYSARRVCAGFTDGAPKAGKHAASAEIEASALMAHAIEAGSAAPVLKSNPLIKRVEARPQVKPSTIPAATNPPAWRKTRLRTSKRGCSDCHPDANLPSALSDTVGQYSADSNGSQQ